MRLLIVLNGRFPTEKAYGLQVLAMARGCVEAGVQVAVAYPQRTKEQPPEMAGVRYFPLGRYLPLVMPWLFPLLRVFGLFGLRRVAREFRPDLVLANDPLQVAFFPWPWKVMWDLHDVPNLDRADRRWLVRRVLRRAACILSTNQIKLERLKDIFGTLPPSVVLRNPVTFDPEVYRKIPREEARRRVGVSDGECAVVYAGQLFSWKGTDTLIAAAEHLAPPVKIHMVGGLGHDLERSRALARNLAAGSDRVIFHGQRPAEEIPYWLRAADVVVIPNTAKERISREDTNPMKLYEALAAEATIVASDLPSLREAAAGALVHFVPPDDPRALAQEILLRSQGPRQWSDLRTGPEGSSRLLTARERVKRLETFIASLSAASTAHAPSSSPLAQRIATGLFWTGTFSMMVKIMGVAMTALLLYAFTLQEYGSYQLAFAVRGLLVLLLLPGLDQLVIARGAKLFHESPEDEARFMSGYLSWHIVAGVVMWIALLVVGWAVPSVAGVPSAQLQILAFAFLLDPFLRFIRYDLSIRQRFFHLNLLDVVETVVRGGALIVALLVLHAGLVGALWAYILAQAVAVVAFVGVVAPRVRTLLRMPGRWTGLIELVKSQGVWALLETQIRQGEKNLRPVIVSFIAGKEVLAIYAVAEKMMMHLITIVPAHSILIPVVSSQDRNTETSRRILSRGAKYSLALYGLIGLLAALFARLFLTWLFPQYLPSLNAFYMFLVYLPFAGIAYLLTSFYFSKQEQKQVFFLVLIRFVSFIVLAPVLVWLFGAVGAGLEFVLTLLLFNALRYWTLCRRHPELRVRLRELVTIDEVDRQLWVSLWRRLTTRLGRRTLRQ